MNLAWRLGFRDSRNKRLPLWNVTNHPQIIYYGSCSHRGHTKGQWHWEISTAKGRSLKSAESAKDKLEGEWSKLLLCAELDGWKQYNEEPTRQKVLQGVENATKDGWSAEQRQAQMCTQNSYRNRVFSEDSLLRKSGVFVTRLERNEPTVSSWNEKHDWKIRNLFGDKSYWAQIHCLFNAEKQQREILTQRSLKSMVTLQQEVSR